ncbi:MAG: D-isomer specific 2-hydroxyacid dehydrogenase family protein [Lachnospiraceae bacterium]
MGVTVYSYREFDEAKWFHEFSREYGIELNVCEQAPCAENVLNAEGSLCIDILTSPMDRDLLERFYQCGVRYITTRTIGYDHIDIQAAKELGITVANAPYGANGVADYTLMLMLMSIRKMKCIMQRNIVQDYTLRGLQGRELADMTVGVIGTGRIGQAVIQHLSGFGCRIVAYDLYPNETVKQYASYVDLDTVWQESDLITFHAPLMDTNYHMLNQQTIGRLKEGVVLINTARGGLIDTQSLIEGIESGKIGAVGLDVIEEEFSLYYYDRKSDILQNRELGLLQSYPNVTISHHMAFYTDNYSKTVIRDSLQGCVYYAQGVDNPWVVA